MKIGPYDLNKVHQGDALERLKDLPDESIHCCITSPPYWGLRDYGTASWEGGDTACDHKIPAGENDPKYGERKNENSSHTLRFNRTHCYKCGAKRIDRQIGIEETPEAFVENLVKVFREVKRVLRKDGTLWINLGISYSRGDRPESRGDKNRKGGLHKSVMDADGYGFGGTCASQSPLLWRVPACGTDGIAPPDSQAAGRVCPDFDGEYRGVRSSHHASTVRSDRSSLRDGQQTLRTDHDSGSSDYVPASPAASPPYVQESTTPQSYDRPPDVSDLLDTVSVSQQGPQTLLPGAPPFADTSACTSGTSPMSPPLVVRTRGKESFFSACGSPDCQGIGHCGLCWCRLAIPSLNIKAKDEVNTPHLLAMALQADGWVLRQTICWHKPNPMPESVQDRCTKSHEYIFMLTKSERYFYDNEAIKEPNSPDSRKDTQFKGSKKYENGFGPGASMHPLRGHERWPEGGRNHRSVWTIPTLPYQDAHFATFPPKLVEIPILAGTSEKGCCPKCGKGWEREVERTPATSKKCPKTDALYQAQGGAGVKRTGTIGMSGGGRIDGETRTLGFRPACKCRAKEMYCGVCGFVIELWHENKTKHNADLQNVSETIQSRQPKKTILQPPLLQSAATETGGQEVHPVREGIQTIFSSHKMLRENLCGGLDGETPERKDGISGMGENDQGVHNGQNARAPDGSQNGICNETSSCNGEPFGEALGAERNSPPQERESGGQPDRELDPHGQEGARWIQETNIRGDMPIMRKCLPNPQTCPHCRSQSFIERDALRHPIILDPFAGSGTTLAVAQGLGRNAIGFDLNEKYAHDIAAVRLKTARTGMKAAEVRAGQMFMFEEE